MRRILFFSSLIALGLSAGQERSLYKVLPGITEGNLTIYPLVSARTYDTSRFLTLDEGIRTGMVTVTEARAVQGLVRRPEMNDGVWREQFPPPLHWPIPPVPAPQVNTLALVNNSDRPLLLLAGEIVTGGKQDRIVGDDRIVPAHSGPVSLAVFCVEPHRWTPNAAAFGGTAPAIAQPSVRRKAAVAANQQEVWNQVQLAREALLTAAPDAVSAIQSNSSYARAIGSAAVQDKLAIVTAPFDLQLPKLKEEHAIGVVAAVNGRILWADTFASSDLFQRYWPKLIASYAAESLTCACPEHTSTTADAQAFINAMSGSHETAYAVPGAYRLTRTEAADYTILNLTSLLPGSQFSVHIAKSSG